ncbi:MAG TPA: helix-turn-helix domain-containing protein [Candidatus Omnitrophota bacterium]|nr:helix-turn-helix domain-containing protein [Candidatus Omnitrophota bacterium]HRZ15144.1 helix-turn-helix domain-containing protein [Candidatus Omnitrophota bacterium]
MAEDKLLTVREVAHVLNITEKEVIDLAESGAIPAYNVGGVYIRFKQHQVEEFKKHNKTVPARTEEYTLKDKLFDFIYFNDFYLVSFLLILALLYVIFKK